MKKWQIIGMVKSPTNTARFDIIIHALDRVSAIALVNAMYYVKPPVKLQITQVNDKGKSSI